MSTSVHTHRSTATIKPIAQRGRTWKPDPITPQFRFVIRMAFACAERDVPYVLTWGLADGIMSATITATGNIPMPKPLPKLALAKPRRDWKPRMFEAEYRLDAWEGNKRKRPGFVIAHSSGLSLVRPSDTGEWPEEDARYGWRITHSASGLGFGVDLPFSKAVIALSSVAGTCDWTLPVEQLRQQAGFSRAGLMVQANYGKGWTKERAKERLALALAA
jgi:hypothetical protein